MSTDKETLDEETSAVEGDTPSSAPDLASEAQPIQSEPSVPPILSGKALLRRGFARWVLMGLVRVAYRRWTRIAAALFPEDSRRAAFATRIGIPLPDRLNLSWITPQLAVGGRILPTDIQRLASTGIACVVDTRSEYSDDPDALGEAGIRLLYLPTPDTYPLSVEQLREGAQWVNAQLNEGHRVLIHCEHGVGRSVLLTAAALVAQGMNAHDALTLIQKRRWQAAPNHRQVVRLQEFERATHGQQTISA